MNRKDWFYRQHRAEVEMAEARLIVENLKFAIDQGQGMQAIAALECSATRNCDAWSSCAANEIPGGRYDGNSWDDTAESWED